VSGPYSAEWQDAYNAEMGALIGNETWVMEDLPPGKKPISSKLVFDLKR